MSPCPRSASGRRPDRGLALRDLRHRPAPRARGLRPARARCSATSGPGRSWRRAPPSPGGSPAPGSSPVRRPAAARAGRAGRDGRRCACEREPIDLLEFRGAFCRYKVVPATRLLRVPDALSTRAAALTEPTAIAIHTVNLSGVTPGDRVLVTGAGPVGLLTIAVLRARGIDDITVSEPAPARRERALAVGATRAVAPDALGRAPMGRPVDDAYVVAFECSGHGSAGERRARAARLRRDARLRRARDATSRAVDHNRMIVLELTRDRRLQLRRRRLRARARAAGLGRAAPRPAHGARRRPPRRGPRRDARASRPVSSRAR